MNPSRARGLLLVGIAFAAIGCTSAAIMTQRPVRSFQLRFQLSDFVVPANARWRLTWSSPYHEGDICPGYDVRVEEGSAFVGEHGEVQGQAFDDTPGRSGILDLSAANGKAVAWLEPGTRFGIANELLKIEVSAFPLAR